MTCSRCKRDRGCAFADGVCEDCLRAEASADAQSALRDEAARLKADLAREHSLRLAGDEECARLRGLANEATSIAMGMAALWPDLPARDRDATEATLAGLRAKIAHTPAADRGKRLAEVVEAASAWRTSKTRGGLFDEELRLCNAVDALAPDGTEAAK